MHPSAKAIMLKLQALKSRVNVTLSQSISNGTFLIGTHSGSRKKKKMNKNKLWSQLNIFFSSPTVTRMMYSDETHGGGGFYFILFLWWEGKKSIWRIAKLPPAFDASSHPRAARKTRRIVMKTLNQTRDRNGAHDGTLIWQIWHIRYCTTSRCRVSGSNRPGFD